MRSLLGSSRKLLSTGSSNLRDLYLTMTTNMHDDLLKRVQAIRVNSRHGRRSPHKPLLMLLSIGRYLNGHQRLAAFNDIEDNLNRLIRRFGLPDSRENAHYPFWHLRNDGLWEIDRPELVRMTTVGDAYVSDLREHNIRGGLVQSFLDVLQTSPSFAWLVVQSLLDDYFPPSLQEDVLGEVGLLGKTSLRELIDTTARPEARDRNFRDMVLRAYQERCALCELEVRVDGRPVGLEAAHIQWHSAKGPAHVGNGIALCVLHHKFFDAGLFTVLPDLTILVGELAEGGSVNELLDKYGGSLLPVVPDHPDQRPNPAYLQWHARAVFKARRPAAQVDL